MQQKKGEKEEPRMCKQDTNQMDLKDRSPLNNEVGSHTKERWNDLVGSFPLR